MTRKIKFNITEAHSGVAISVKVTTRAEKTEYVGLDEDNVTLRIRLTAQSAETPEANQELINFLAQMLSADPSQFELVAGETKRIKLISIQGFKPDELNERFAVDE